MFFTNRFVLVGIFSAFLFPAVSNSRQTDKKQQSPAPPIQSNIQQSPPSSRTADGQAGQEKQADPKSRVGPKTESTKASSDVAWSLLSEGAKSDKFRDRSDAISALTVLEGDRRAIAIIANALGDKEETIRVLAATSLGDMKARAAIPNLKNEMDDKSPQVSFAAAQALWKMGDRSGRDIFLDVLDGERKVKPNLIKSKIHQARMDMHDPKALALIGVNEASGAFLGPFSMGVSMVEEYAKNSGVSVQAFCAQLLAADPGSRTVEELTDALGDSNWTVRVAAARSLAKLEYDGARSQLRDMMVNDRSQPARFAAAAAIIRIGRHPGREQMPRWKMPSVDSSTAHQTLARESN